MVARGLSGAAAEPLCSLPGTGTARSLRLLPGVQATHRSCGPAGTGTGALVSAPRSLTASRGSSLAALGLRTPKLGQRRPVVGVHGAPGRILLSGQAVGLRTG